MSIEKQILSAVHKTLINDETLMSLLASNLPAGKTRGTKSPIYSVIPTGQATIRMASPFIVLETIVTDRLDFRFSATNYTVAVYAEESASGIRVYDVLERVRELLDGQPLDVPGFVKNTYETNGDILNSEALSLQFAVATYRCQFVR